MRHGFAQGAAFFIALSASACSVDLSRSESGDIVRNKCTSQSDCSAGTCWEGVCVAGQGSLSSLLLELTPPTSAPSGIAGARFLKMQDDLQLNSAAHDINLTVVSTVHAYFSSKCRFDATLTPEQESYGLSPISYLGRTAAVAATTQSQCPQGRPGSKELAAGDLQELVVNIPEGSYGVYLRQSPDAGATSCNAVPVDLGLIEAKPGISCVTLGIPATQTLDVTIPWPATDMTGLGNWTVDIVHPVTGQVLSQENALRGTPQTLDSGVVGYELKTLDYSPAAAAGTMSTHQELLRISPPSPGDGPVVQLSLAGLIASSTAGPLKGVQTIVLPPIGPFPKKVHVEGSVYDDVDQETAVPSTLTFTATKLDALPNGVPASFSTTAVVRDDGQVGVDLLPGDYRVRVAPNIDPDAQVHWAAQETTWNVGASDAATQRGRVIGVHRAAAIKGRAFSVLGGELDGASVQALPGSIGMRRCSGRDASVCAEQPISALDVALAEGAFVPRSVNAVTAGNGSFVVQDVDCGDCTSKPGAGALFDVTVRPADGSRLPWIIQPGVVVDSSATVDLGDLRNTLPIVQRGVVQVPQETDVVNPQMPAANNPIRAPGTLINAYLLRDASGAPIFNPKGLSSCATGTYSGAESTSQCIRSALQVAQTRADAQGNYELVLPVAIDGMAQ